MSKLSNNQGRAYEFACLNELYKSISEYRNVELIKNSSYTAAKRAFATLTEKEKQTYRISALAMIPSIFKREPRIIEDDTDTLELYIQKDEEGEKGDVRDIIIARDGIKWEIGLSIKHNHFAVKHSRLSPSIDFGEKWFGFPCSEEYWEDIEATFRYLEKAKQQGKTFSEIPNKENKIYGSMLF